MITYESSYKIQFRWYSYTKNKVVFSEITEIASPTVKQYHYYTDIYDTSNAIPIFDVRWKIIPPESVLMFVNKFKPYYE